MKAVTWYSLSAAECSLTLDLNFHTLMTEAVLWKTCFKSPAIADDVGGRSSWIMLILLLLQL